MSFSTETKNELSRILVEDNKCNICELSGIVRLSGSIQIVGYKKLSLKITTELSSVARKVFKILKDNFNINTEIYVNKNQTLKRNNNYVLIVTDEMGSQNLLKELRILNPNEDFLPMNTVPKDILNSDECIKSFIRGAFIGGGSISNPGKNYHLEFVTNNEEFAHSLKELINEFGFNSKVVSRKNNYVVYLKESEQISDLLSIIGAHTALLNLQNAKIVKAMRNNVNRIVNCETANLSKTVNAAVRQIENIKLIKSTIGIDSIPANLQEIANLRLMYEDLSLKELGEMLTPPIGKSGVNHRLRKIEEIAQSIKNS